MIPEQKQILCDIQELENWGRSFRITPTLMGLVQDSDIPLH